MMRLFHILELLEHGSTKIVLSKRKLERKLFAGDHFKKQLLKLFNLSAGADKEDRVITKGTVKSNRTGINSDVFIK